MISAVFSFLFGLSLLPGRKPLCMWFAERISDGIVPEDSARYCRVLTWIWFFLLLLVAVISLTSGIWWLGTVVVPFALLAERPFRNRRFSVVFHTSGSTGASKTIVKTFASLAKETAMHRQFYAGLSRSVRFIGTVQWNHMLGKLWMDMLPKALGLPADPEVVMTPEALLAKMNAAEQVFLVTTPSFLDRLTLYADQYHVPRNCVEIVTSGALLTADVSARTKRVFGIEPRQIFGSTETGGVAWRRGDGLWQVFDPVRVRDVGGRIGVRSPFSFRRNYVMGDGLELSPDRRSFKLLGRRDRLVKINEERVNLAEMEEKVKELGYRDCALVKLAGRHGDCLGLVLVGVEEPPLAVRRKLLPIFPHGTVPKRFRFVADLPRNPQGKVLNNEIVQMF